MADEQQRTRDIYFMEQALEEARRAAALGEVPIGAVVVDQGKIIGRGHNRREIDRDPLAHAEILAIRQAAAARNGWRLLGSTMYVTLEPCFMCAGALVLARVERLVYGAADPKAGAVASLVNLVQFPGVNHHLQVQAGICEEQCRTMLRDFFRELRQAKAGVSEGNKE